MELQIYGQSPKLTCPVRALEHWHPRKGLCVILMFTHAHIMCTDKRDTDLCYKPCWELVHHSLLDPRMVFVFLTIAPSLKLYLAPVSVTELSTGTSPMLRSPLSHLLLWTFFFSGVCPQVEREMVSCLLGHQNWRTWIRSCWWPSSIICGNVFSAGMKPGGGAQSGETEKVRGSIRMRGLDSSKSLRPAVSLPRILLTCVFLTYPLNS